ncbi:uncharacterized protein LOC128222769 [Mya arenaria]|uniref:uncharacterized protein LOC128222769 n=1 Tax=Mya arenaria TaxID=6604 RepID=UPI0022DF3716|nr:uncharacterized protein LOC128222769 [Mya arenaria]XP_052787847.1 uncharacterized protein LOC128222769 [Mya arenaria]
MTSQSGNFFQKKTVVVQPIVLVILITSITAFLLACVSLGIPTWRDSTVDAILTRTVSTHTYSGLWATCSHEEVRSSRMWSCSSFITDGAKGYTPSLRACQGCSVLGTMFSAVVVAVVVAKLCCFKNAQVVTIAIAVCSIIAATFLIVSVVTYSIQVRTDQGFNAEDFSTGIYITIVSIVFLVISGVLAIFGYSMDKGMESKY